MCISASPTKQSVSLLSVCMCAGASIYRSIKLFKAAVFNVIKITNTW